VKPGGFITGDDDTEGGMQRAVDEFVREGEASVGFIREAQFVLRRGSSRPVAARLRDGGDVRPWKLPRRRLTRRATGK
jgi:hypothetical protein